MADDRKKITPPPGYEDYQEEQFRDEPTPPGMARAEGAKDPRQDARAGYEQSIRQRYNLPPGTNLHQESVPEGVNRQDYINAYYEASQEPPAQAAAPAKKESAAEYQAKHGTLGLMGRELYRGMREAIREPAAGEKPPYYGLMPGNILKNAREMTKGAVLGPGLPVTPEGWRKEVIDPAAEMGRRAAAAKGVERAGRIAGMTLPVVGPMATGIGEQIGRGDVGGGLGQLGALALMGHEAKPDEVKVPGKTLPETPKPNLPVPKVGLQDLSKIFEEEFGRAGPRGPSASAQLDAAAQQLFKQNYGDLTHEQQIEVGRHLGTPSAPLERRQAIGQAPGPMERRAGFMPQPRPGPGPEPTGMPVTPTPKPSGPAAPGAAAAVPGVQLETDSMGIRWAKAPGVNPVSIPPRMTDPAEISRYVAEKQALQRQGVPSLGGAGGLPTTPAAKVAPAAPVQAPGALPAAPPTTTLPSTPAARAEAMIREQEGRPLSSSEQDIKQAMEHAEAEARRTKQPPPQPGTPERPPPGEETDPLKREFPDPKLRQHARINGPEAVRAANGDMDTLAALSQLSNVQVRQAALNAGIELGTRHVGTRIGLGPEQISRADLIGQMIREGNSPMDIVRLAQTEATEYSKPMPIPQKQLRGLLLTPEAVLHHEWGHAINGERFLGITTEGMTSHRGRAGPGGIAAVSWRLGMFRNPYMGGWLDARAMTARFGPQWVVHLVDMIASGAAANELIDGIPHQQNPGLAGDLKMANEIFVTTDVPIANRPAAWQAAVDRAKVKLQEHPQILDIIREEAGRREENLPVGFHASKARITHVVGRINDLVHAQTPTQTGTAALEPGAGAPGGAVHPATPAVAQGAAAPGAGAGVQAPEKLKPYRPPRGTFTFEIEHRDPASGLLSTTEETIQAPDRRQAFKKAAKQFPNARSIQFKSEEFPQVQSVFFQFDDGRPLARLRDPEEGARDLARKEQDSREGLPVNPLTILEKGGKQYAVGGLGHPDVPIERAADLTIDRGKQFGGGQNWRYWYENLRNLFEKQFGGGQPTERKLGAFMLSQRKTSPSRGMQNVFRIQDAIQKMASETGGEAKPPMGAPAIRGMLQGQPPESGAGPKLNDFADSITGHQTRTWMNADPRGLQPAAADTHAARAAGYIDQPMLNWIRENWGDRVANKFQVDLRSPGAGGGVPDRYQYERINEFYNRLKDEYNRRGYDGGNWIAAQAQADAWGPVGQMLGRTMDQPEAIFDRNTRRLAYEAVPSPQAPYGQQYGQLWQALPQEEAARLTQDVSEPLMDMVMREAGGHKFQNFYGPGGWMGSITPAGVVDVLGSPAAAARAANAIGYLLQQDSVVLSRPLYSGADHWLQINEVGSERMLDRGVIEKFWNTFRTAFPEAEGFQPVRYPNGAVGIRVLKVGGHMRLENPQQFAAAGRAAQLAADAVGIKEVDVWHGGAEVHFLGNDWAKNPRGQEYLARLQQSGAPGTLHRVRDVYRPAIAEIMEKYFGRIRGRLRTAP
jgi:hypothetical protein